MTAQQCAELHRRVERCGEAPYAVILDLGIDIDDVDNALFSLGLAVQPDGSIGLANEKEIRRKRLYDQIVTMFLDGTSQTEIVRLLDTNRTTVHNVLQKHGLTRKVEKGTVPVRQIDPQTGRTIREFCSMRAAVDATGTSQCCIAHCLNGWSKTAGGYRWERING